MIDLIRESKRYVIQKDNHDFRSSIGLTKKPLITQEIKIESSKKLAKQLNITGESNRSLNSNMPNQKSPRNLVNEERKLSNKRALTQSNLATAKTFLSCSIRPGQPAKVRISVPTQNDNNSIVNNTTEIKLNEDHVVNESDHLKSEEIFIDEISKFN